MFWWNSKKQKIKYKIFIPEDKISEFTTKYSEFTKFHSLVVTYEQKYNFWNFIHTVVKKEIDEIKSNHPNCSFNMSINVEDVCNPYVQLELVGTT